jgi:hypothetical protein
MRGRGSGDERYVLVSSVVRASPTTLISPEQAINPECCLGREAAVVVVALLSHVLRVVVHDACTQYKGREQRSALLSVTIHPPAHGLRCTHALNTVLVHWRIQYRQTYLRSKQASDPADTCYALR